MLATPLRRLIHRPERILSGLVLPGQTVADLGCGPGFFTIPMAKMVGPQGHVLAVDLQQGMLARLRRRAESAGVVERIRLCRSSADTLGIDEELDFALAFYMVHEVPDARAFLEQVREALSQEGRLLVAEPKFHVSAAGFRATLEIAAEVGLRLVSAPRIFGSRTALFARA